MQEQTIVPRDTDYSKWYHSVIDGADLLSETDTPGCMIMNPNCWAIWERIQRVFDERIKETGHRNAQYPLLIPRSYIESEAEHVDGFAPELAQITEMKGKKLDDPLVLRPTSETIIHTDMAKKVKTRDDLPILLNQWANVFRMEMKPRPLLRSFEFFWQEGHTAHAEEEEAQEEVLRMLVQYQEFIEQTLAIPCVTGEKSAIERFAGADRTFTAETMMQDIKALQSATSHNLGTTFSKAFGISFEEDEQEHFAHLTSWGMSTRIIGATIMSHSDDKGLVLPPNIAPTQAVLLGMPKASMSTEKLEAYQGRVTSALRNGLGIRFEVDNAGGRIGKKHFKWEKYGVPLRLVVGEKEIDKQEVMVVRRDTSEKIMLSIDNLDQLNVMLGEMQQGLFDQSAQRLANNSMEIDDYVDVKSEFKKGNKFVYTGWAGTAEDEKQLKKSTGITIRCVPLEKKTDFPTCFMTGKPAQEQVLLAKAY